LFTGGAAGIWAVDLFSTNFGEIIIFVVSKDQTFRIRCTLMNPEQFFILVPYLILWKFSQIIKNKHILRTLNFLTFLGTFQYLSVELAEFSFQTRFIIVNRHSSYDKEQPTYANFPNKILVKINDLCEKPDN
jgi:hypothetical protein